MKTRPIILKNVCVHNLKSVDITLQPHQLIVFTGVSGSGKSSLAFDTIYVEGQRRYVESLSTFARRYMDDMNKPDVEHVSGLTPTISIEQKTAGRNPRSTVGTMTEIYDYLRVLYARIAIPHCPISGEAVLPQSRERIIKSIQSLPENKKILILAPYAQAKKAEFKEDFQDLLRKGFMRARVDGKIVQLDNEISLDGNIAHDVDVVIDRITLKPDVYSRIAEGITTALSLANGLCRIVDAETDEEQLFSMHAFSPKSGISYQALEPQDFSFNSPTGMCPTCQGLGSVNAFDLSKVIDPNLSIAEDCCSLGSSYKTVRFGNIYDNLAEIYGFSVHTPWKKLSEKAKKVFLHGTEKKWTQMQFVHPDTGATWQDYVHWRGILYEAETRYTEAKSDSYRTKVEKLMSKQTCPACHGERLKPYPAAALLNGKKISAVSSMTVQESLEFFNGLKLTPNEQLIAEELLKEIKERLQFLLHVGLHYLTLDRTAPTLSGGEAQRVRLASQIGCGLVGVTYILDEPSIGLHPRDNKKLIETLKHLRNIGNTVIVVEHDEETMWEADHIIDVGPGPGVRGGEIVVDGSVQTLLSEQRSLTGAYLSGRKEIAIPKKRRKPSKSALLIKGASHNNLKEIDVKIPLGLLVAVTGVSGSGKSSLISDILFPALSNALHKGEHVVGAHQEIKGIDQIDKVIAIDQSPIGRNPRSNPSTYIKVFDDIRDLFSQLPESQARGYTSGRFSFNVKEGSCPQCHGMGMTKIDMDFMDSIWVECTHCKSRRFDEETLSVLYKGKNIYDVLEMEVGEALQFFEHIPQIKHKLETLSKVGMDYIRLGQPSTTLSGGEAQRVKLAKELVRPSTGKTLYIFDEPTTGLHFYDIDHLLVVLHELVERGNSVIVIEHNMEVVKTADWILDMGPEGGGGGGELIAEGPPEKLAKLSNPTSIALEEILYLNRAEKIKILQKAAKKKKAAPKEELITEIIVHGAEQNNLKQLDVRIPRDKMTVLTGPSGSGKSSLAFETIYAEGQRRYIESLSPYARQFVKQMPKPKVAKVEGLSPAIAIEQKVHAGNPRSTVGTMTEIYDYLRVLFARLGMPHCPETGEVIKAISKEYVVDTILSYNINEKIQILAPIELKKSDKFEDLISRFLRQGFLRIRLNDTFYELDSDIQTIPYDRKKKNEIFLVIDRLKVDPSTKHRLYEDVENAEKISGGKVVVMRESGDQLFNLSFAVASTGKSYPEITPHTFSFNNLEGMCPDCQGLGYQYGAQLSENQILTNLSLNGLLKQFWQDKLNHDSSKTLQIFLQAEKIDPSLPLAQLSPKKLQLLMKGSPEEQWYRRSDGLQFQWLGINHVLAKAGRAASSQYREIVLPLLDEHDCPSCKGSRLNPLAQHVTIQNKSIADFCRLPMGETIRLIKSMKIPAKDAKLLDETLKQLKNRLEFLCEVGLHYLSLDRRAPTLSGGEAQRIRLARQLGSGLTGVLYVLDEPTIGLHPRDTGRLNQALKQLKELGNTLLMVEHDPLTIQTADYLIDFGPHAGQAGGHITAQGTIKQIEKNPKSLTGAYLSGAKTIPLPEKRRPFTKKVLQIQNAKVHNLKNISVSFPVGALTCITGVSGSGKSTLMHDILTPALERNLGYRDEAEIKGAKVSGMSHFDRLIQIDQNPIGLTSRSDVCTYVDVLTPIRHFYASLPAAKVQGLQAKNFSYNHRKGMCTHCWGMGYRRIEMHFLPALKVVCEDCHGMRLNSASLEVRYAGKNLGQILDSTVDEARQLFENHRKIVRILDTLISVGLGYLKLGQEMASLSGGEAQRIKLSRELSKRSTGNTIYLVDEPTTGLHSEDISKLLKVVQQLVDKGNTMIIIEHNLDMIKNADYVVDLGPDAGVDGGKIVCEGTPEQVAKHKTSYTAQFLKGVLKPK